MNATGTNRERSFGLSVGAICCLLWLVYLWKGRGNLLWLGSLGGSLLLLGWLAPALLRVPSAIWWKFAEILGWINARVILTAVFLFVFVPVGWVMRLLGRDPLRLRRATRLTAWEPYPARMRTTMHYERMF